MIRLRTTPAVLFGGLLVLALLVFLPMRLALGWVGLGQQGFNARAITGSIWGGTLKEARFGDLGLGTLDASLSPLALLIGRARVSLDGGATLHGAMTISRNARGVDKMSGTLPTGGVFAPLPVTQLTLDELTVHFEGDTCDMAEGRVTAAMGGEVAGIALPASVSGNARCDGGALLLPLASQSGAESVSLRVTGAGAYTAMLSLAPSDPAAGAKLAELGFIATQNGYQLSVQGSF